MDGLSDEGYGESIVYTRICGKKFGSFESTLVDDFKRLVRDGDYVLIGFGEHAVHFCRQSGVMNKWNLIPRHCLHGVRQIRNDYTNDSLTQ